MAYQQRLNYWAIAQLLPSQRWIIVARLRNRSDADGHFHFLRHTLPNLKFQVVFDLSE